MPKTRRSIEDRIADLEAKVTYHNECAAKLKEKIEGLKVQQQKASKITMKTLVGKAKEKGISEEQLMAMIESYSNN